VEDLAGGDGVGRSGSFLSSSYSGESIGEGSSCWRDMNVSCEAVDSRRSIATYRDVRMLRQLMVLSRVEVIQALTTSRASACTTLLSTAFQ